MSEQQAFVSITVGNETLPVGRLWYRMRKGRESSSFEYDPSWLTSKERFALEPALPLTQGVFHVPSNRILFGSIEDTAPDRWGRVLMRRAERQRAKEEKEAISSLSELDYALGVNDEARQGALRFSETEGGPFLNPASETAIPPLVALPLAC